MSCDMTLSNAEEIVVLADTVPKLLGVNHHRDGLRDGRTSMTDSNRGNRPSVAFLLKSTL
jgi:hypothetical protein